MRLFINSLASSAGGGLTYIRNVIPELAARPGLHITVAVMPGLKDEFQSYSNVDFVELRVSGVRRFWHEQVSLSGMIRSSRADLLLSAGNFAMRKSPVPQILLSRNSLYTSTDFYRDLLKRNEYRMWLDTRLRGWLAQKSITWADLTVAPSEAFAVELRKWTGGPRIIAIHHGFDSDMFTRDERPLNSDVQQKLQDAQGTLKLLFVSHYNYYRNFETLIRALPLIRDQLQGRKVKLLLTCKLAPGANPGAYRPELIAQLVRELGVSETVVELGAIPYCQLHQLYRLADIYVTPAYAETFAHPLVEAMSSGLPVIASDLPVHQEICGDAALYFSRFSAKELASRVIEVAGSGDVAARLSQRGLVHSASFSWKKHIDEILSIAHSLTRIDSVSTELTMHG